MRRRWFAALGAAVGALLLLALLGVLGLGAFLHTDAGQRWARARLERALSAGGQRASVGGVHTDLWTGVRLDDLHLETDTLVLDAGRIDADLDRNALLRGELRLSRVAVDGARLDLTAAEPDGPSEPFSGLGVDLQMDRIDLSGGQIAYRAADGAELVRVVGATGTARLVARGSEVRVEGLDLRGMVGLQGAAPARVEGGAVVVDPAGTHLRDLEVRLPNGDLGVSGDIADALDVAIDARRLDLSDVDLLLGRPGIDGTVAGDVALTGPSDRLSWRAALSGIDDTPGTIDATGTVDLTGDELGWTVDARLDAVDLARLVPAMGEPLVVTGRARVDGTGTAWPDGVEIALDWRGEAIDAFGQHLDATTATVRIARGEVILERTALDGILGELDITGRVGVADGREVALLATGTVLPHRLRALGVQGVDSPGYVRATIEGDLSDPDAPIRVRGTVRFAPFRSGDSVAFDEAEVAFDVWRRGERVDGTASVQATGGDLGGIAVAGAVVPEMSIHTGPGGTEVAGDLEATELSRPDTLWAGAARGTWRWTDAGATASLALDRLELAGLPGTGGRIDVTTRGDVVTLDVRLDHGDRALLRTRGTYDLAAARLELSELSLRPGDDLGWRAARPVALTLTDGGVADADLAVEGDAGDLVVTGRLGTTGPVDGTVKLRRLDLGALARVDPARFAGLDGVVDLDLSLRGTGEDPEIDVRIDADGLASGDAVRELGVHGWLSGAGGRLRTELELSAGDAPVAKVHGALPAVLDLSDPHLDPDGEADLVAVLLPGPLGRLASLSPSAASVPEGEASAVLEVSGRLGDPALRLAGVAEVRVEGWSAPLRAEYEAVQQQGVTSWWADIRTGYRTLGQLFATAHTDLGPTLRTALVRRALPENLDPAELVDDMMVHGVVLEVPPALLARAAGVDDVVLEGALTGGFQVTGSPRRPALSCGLNWVGGRIGRQRIEGLDLALDPAPDGLALTLDAAFASGQRFTVRGPIPLQVDLATEPDTWSTAPMDLRVDGAIPLRAITALIEGAARSEGEVQIAGRIGGTPFDPDPTLSVRVPGAAFNLNTVGIRVENATVDATVARNRVAFEAVAQTRPSRARLNIKDVVVDATEALDEQLDAVIGDEEPLPESAVKVVGDIGLDKGAVRDVDLRVRLANGAWLAATADTAIRMDGRLKVAGTWPELAVGGRLALRQGFVHLDAAAFVDRAPLVVDPRIAIAGRTRGPRDAHDEPPWYSALTASVALDLRRAMELDVSMPFVDDLGALGAFVSRADLLVRLGGEAQLALAGGEPSMVGEVDVHSGRLAMLGRRFDVEEGTIRFTGGDIAEPELSIRATTKVAQVPIAATVDGTPSAPGIQTECEGYTSQSDCLMLILTGRVPEESTALAQPEVADGAEAATTPTEEGDAGVGSALTGLALNSVLGEQNVADIRFNPDGSFEIGAALANWLYLTYTLNPNATQFQENRNTVEADIGLGRRTGLNLGAGEVTSWADLFWEIRF